MAHMSKADAALVIRKLENYSRLDLHGRPYDEVGWISFHYSCDRAEAARKIVRARKLVADPQPGTAVVRDDVEGRR